MTDKSVVVSKSNANLPAAVSSLTSLSQAAVATAGELNTGDAYGQFTKQGEWIFGQERLEVQEGSRWAINPLSLSHGFIHWPGEGRPTEMMVPATHPLPALADLPPVNGDWGKNAAFQAQCMSGEDEGQQVIWKGSSLGFRKAWGNVAQAIGQRATDGELEVVPVIELHADSYQHKQFGKIMTPDVQIVDWMTLDGLGGEGKAEDEKPEPEQEAAPAEKEAVAEAPKPRRRRRRKAS